MALFVVLLAVLVWLGFGALIVWSTFWIESDGDWNQRDRS